MEFSQLRNPVGNRPASLDHLGGHLGHILSNPLRARLASALRGAVGGGLVLACVLASAVSPAALHAEDGAAATFEEQGGDLQQALSHLFDGADATQVPTGLLLETSLGAWSSPLPAAPIPGSGPAAEPMTAPRLRESLASLERARLSPTSGPRFALEGLETVAMSWRRDHDAYAIAVAVVDYDTVDEAELQSLAVDGEGRYVWPAGPIGRTERFAAAAPVLDTVYGPNPRFVLPSELFLVGSGKKKEVLPAASVRYTGRTSWRPVELDQPFEADDFRTLADGSARFEVRLEMATGPLEMIGSFGTRTPIVRPYCDLPAPVADPASGAALHVRIYPGVSNSVPFDPADPDACAPALVQPLVIADGFDVSNTRTQAQILDEFGDSISAFRQLDFDVIVLDYDDGQRSIYENGDAIRQFLVQVLPTLMAPASAQEAVLIGASMGSQTSAYALRRAEQLGTDHNVGLFVSLDGPWRGANVPISLQATLDAFAPLSRDARTFYRGLTSPAATQLLRRTRVPRGNTGVVDWYEPRQEHIDYYADLDSYGLPKSTRNVALASGSGSGQLQNGDGLRELYAFLDRQGVLAIDLEAWTDHHGRAFSFLARFTNAIGSVIPAWSRSLHLSPDAEVLDLVPGGWRNSGGQLLDSFLDSAAGNLGWTGELENHAFIPTFSALYIDTDDLRYEPSIDLDVFQLSPFDAIFWEDCNLEHVYSSNAGMSFLVGELLAFRAGQTPAPQTVPFGGPCGVSDYSYWSHYSRNPTAGKLGTWHLNTDDVHLAGNFDSDSATELIHLRPASRWLQINDPRPATGGWQYVGGNGGSGYLDDSPAPYQWLLEGKDRYVVGNFDGATVEDEILAVKRVGGSARVVGRSAQTLTRLWDNGGAGTLGPWSLSPDDKLVAGDFHLGDGVDELLAVNPAGHARLLRFGVGGWTVVWQNDPLVARNVGAWDINSPDVFVAGDFEGADGIDELLAINPSNGWSKTQSFGGPSAGWALVDMGSGTVHNGGSGLLGGFAVGPQRTYLVGDFDLGRAGEELLAIDEASGVSHTLGLGSGQWQSLDDNATSGRFALWQIGAADRYLAGDFVGDQQDRVLLIHPGGEARIHAFP